MLKKSLNFSLIALAVIGLSACGQKKGGKMPDLFSSLVSLEAFPDPSPVESLPLEMFSENGELYVRYIKNNKPLDKINLAYSHLDEGKCYYFDEIVDGEKNGTFCIPANIKDLLGEREGLIYISKDNERLSYYFLSFFEDEIKISTTDLHLAAEQLSEIEPVIDEEGNSTYDWIYVKNFVYLLKHYPASIDYPFDTDNVYTSSDGKLRFYARYHYMGGQGSGCAYPLIMAQYKYGDDVFLIKPFLDFWDRKAENKYDINFGYQNGIKIHTIPLHNKTYYLVDFALADSKPMPYRGDYERFQSNGNYLRLYAIEEGELKPQKLFNTTKKLLDEISFMYDGTAMYNADGTSYFDWNIVEYDEDSRTFFIPLIDGVTLTEKYLQYQWDGKYFTYVGIGN
jgi:hypothetical protein